MEGRSKLQRLRIYHSLSNRILIDRSKQRGLDVMAQMEMVTTASPTPNHLRRGWFNDFQKCQKCLYDGRSGQDL